MPFPPPLLGVHACSQDNTQELHSEYELGAT